ncbi:MAG: hypothetical protein R2854_09040 [Caldilineaceae bacterium]
MLDDTPADAVAALKAVLGRPGCPCWSSAGAGRQGQRTHRAGGRSGRGRAAGAGRLRGQELSHHRRCRWPTVTWSTAARPWT